MTMQELTILLQQAETLTQRGNYDEAEQLAHHVLSQCEALPSTVETDLSTQKTLAGAQRMLGVIAWRRGDFNSALARLTEALRVSELANDSIGISKSLGNIGVVHRNLSQYTEALECYTKALAIDESLGNRAGVARNLGHIGVMHHSLSQYATALEYYTQALSIDEDLGNKEGMAAKLGNIGTVHMNLADYPKALDFYAKALALAESTGNSARIAIDLSNIGTVHLHLSDYTSALEYYKAALKIVEQLGNKAGIAVHLGNIGTVLMSLCDYAAAREYYSKALAIAVEIGDQAAVGNQLGRIGTIHWHLKEYAQARDYLARSLDIAEKLGDSSAIATALVSLADVYKTEANYSAALDFYKRGLELQVGLAKKSDAANTRGALGELYATIEWTDRDEKIAEQYLLEAISVSEDLGTKNYEFHRSLSDLYELQGRWKESKIHFKKFYLLKEEVQSEEAKKSARLMEQQKLIAEQEKQAAVAKATADAQMQATTSLLHKVLPEVIASRMIAGENEIADYYTSVSILFADIAGFTKISADLPAIVVVRFLNFVFAEFDRIIKKHGCEKIKTIGDGYMAMCGAPVECPDHAERLTAAAFEMQQTIRLPDSLREHMPENTVLGLRIGLHTGSVVAGVIGEERFVYDIYSDAVNTAARMESHGEENRIHISNDFYRHLQNRFAMTKATTAEFVFEKRGEIEIKGKGMMRTFFMEKV